VFVLLVKETTLTNEKLWQVVTRQKTVISDQLSCITQLQQDLTSTRGSLAQLRAECEYHNTENDQLIAALRLQLHTVSMGLCHYIVYCYVPREAQKTALFYFCNSVVKTSTIMTIFSTCMLQ